MSAADTLAFLRFETPGYLVLLALLPFLVLLSFRSMSGLGRVRRVVAIVTRCVVVAFLVLALAGAHKTKTTDDLSVIFLLDRSNSIPRAWQQREFEFLTASSKAMRPTKDRLGIIAFDGESAVEQLPMNAVGIKRLGESLAPDHTNLAAALRMGVALMPEDTSKRLVLFSDGNENVGEVLDEADQLAAAGIPVDVIPIRYQHDDEIVFERLSAPPTATTEETIDLQMVLRSKRRISGKILLRHNDEIIDLDPDGAEAGQHVTLEPGANRLNIPVPLRVAGAHRFHAEFIPDDAAADTISANNEGRAFTVVSGQGRILILTTEADRASAQILERALASERLVAKVEIAGQPLDQVGLLEYSLVILSNVPAGDLSEASQQALSVYVRDLGGGLIMVGGEDSFGAGGWMGSPVEDVMPVSFDVKSKKQIPKGALALVMHACEIPKGNYWGERIAVAAVKTLSSRDLVGVLAYQWRGGDQGYWVVPLREVGDKAVVIQMIKKMSMGDMPSLHDVMKPAVDKLAACNAAVKHMIVVSDFDPQAPTPALIKKMKAAKITCSTVAIGWGGHWIDTNKAKWIAQQTGGKFYTTQDYSKLPQIFIKESRIVRRSLINETPFTPQRAPTLTAVVRGLQQPPDLGGYVVTTAKPLAQMALIRKTEESDDPVLAYWQVGLGKTVAFTSGMWDRWGVEWAAWPQFSKVWGQLARWASRPIAASAFDVSTSWQGGKGKLRLDALDKNASAINFMTVEGLLVGPGPRYDTKKLRLIQTGPGRYEAEFDAPNRGSYIINLGYRMGSGANAVAGSLRTGLSVAFSAEYRELKANLPLLSELAERTGGRVMSPEEAARAFELSGLRKAESRRPIWEDLVFWGLVLFLIDVAIRRIAINPLEVARKLRTFLAEIAGRKTSAETSAAVLSTLKGTRERVREGMQTEPPPSETGLAPDRSARYEARVPDSKVTEDLSRALDGASEQHAPVVARPTRKAPPTSEADYTSRLLKAKRRARDDMSKDEKDEK